MGINDSDQEQQKIISRVKRLSNESRKVINEFGHYELEAIAIHVLGVLFCPHKKDFPYVKVQNLSKKTK